MHVSLTHPEKQQLKSFDEKKLLASCSCDDQRALKVMYEYYMPIAVDVVVLYLQDSLMVKDVAQDAMIKFCEALKAGKIDSNPKAWLIITVRRLCLDYLKKQKHRMNYEELLIESNSLAEENWTMDKTDEWYESCDCFFWSEFKNFTLSDQFITLAKYYYRYNYARIAELMSVNVEHIRSRTNYVKRTIRRKKKQKG